MEKEMATHSSVLAWRIPWTEEPGGLLSMRSHGVGHDWSDLACIRVGNGNPLQYSCLENPRDRGAWWAVHRVRHDWSDSAAAAAATPHIKYESWKCRLLSLSKSLQPMDCSPPGSSIHSISQEKNTEVGSHSLCQEIFPTHGSNPDLLQCRQVLYLLSHQESP